MHTWLRIFNISYKSFLFLYDDKFLVHKFTVHFLKFFFDLLLTVSNLKLCYNLDHIDHLSFIFENHLCRHA